jgi:hypothetical protein
VSRGVAFEIRDGDAVALTAAGAVRLDRCEFSLLARLAASRRVTERLSLIASVSDCPVCAHPSADRLHDLLVEGRTRDEIRRRLGQVPSSGEMQRHLDDDHPGPPAGGVRPAGWWATVREQLAECGFDLSRPTTWTCAVCRSPHRDALEREQRQWVRFPWLALTYGFSRDQVLQHRRHARP